MSARARHPCRSRSRPSLPTLTLDTPMAFPMDSTTVGKGVDRYGFHVPGALNSYKPLTGLRSSLSGTAVGKPEYFTKDSD
jgi:hypothetical protein